LLLAQMLMRLSSNWQKHRMMCSLLCIAIMTALLGFHSVDSLWFWLVSGIETGIIVLAAFICVAQFDYAIIPAAVGAPIILDQVQQAVLNPFPQALLGALITCAALVGLTILFTVILDNHVRQ